MRAHLHDLVLRAQEGGGRKGLPRSFLNRFTRVYAEALGPRDLRAIASTLHPRLPTPTLDCMIALLALMGAAATAATTKGAAPMDGALGAREGGGKGGARFAVLGGPWEFNLRDLLRWAELTVSVVGAGSASDRGALEGGPGVPAPGDAPSAGTATGAQQKGEGRAAAGAAPHARLYDEAAEHFAHMLFVQRLRAPEDRARFGELFARAWGRPMAPRGRVQVGRVHALHAVQVCCWPGPQALSWVHLPVVLFVGGGVLVVGATQQAAAPPW